ncbi:uncharacterized protein LOC135373242 [Ornithodoros turicata]|uniref:uncharacterized protein LOC135373242 n=1 Tax=Ornithodoros turicata TaxID=34597 RepID=UPI003139AB54
MERAKQKRASRRRQVTKLIGEASTVIANESTDRMLLESLLERLRVNNEELTRLNNELEQYLKEDEMESELGIALQYEDNAVSTMANLRTKISGIGATPIAATTAQVTASSPQSNNTTKSNGIRLPKLQLVRFRGELSMWGSFWEQFKGAIHENDSLSKAEKFYYLRSLLDGPAATAISGLQATEECYADAIEVLTERFGDKRRIEREHLSRLRTLPYVKSSRDVYGLRKLYDHVQTHVRGLKALGVTSESYASMMCEILLSNLPTNLALDYQRQKKRLLLYDARNNPGSTETSSEVEGDASGELKSILNFVRIEIESMEGVNMVDKRQDVNDGHSKDAYKADPPSSHVLYNDTRKRTEACVFCRSAAHTTVKCKSSIPLDERKKKLAKEQRCFRCTKIGHRSRECRSGIVCATCHGRHATSLCDPTWTKSTDNNEDSATDTKSTAEANVLSANMATPTSGNEVMLQTFRAFGVHEDRSVYFRGVIDGGSQRTFIREDVAKLLKLDVIGTITLRLNTFANSKTANIKKYNVVKVGMKSQHTLAEVTLEAIAIPFICNDLIQTAMENELVKEVHGDGGFLADQILPSACPTIHGISFLLGSDQMWKLLTGHVRKSQTNDSLAAIETTFGWTFQGPLSTGAAVRQNANLVICVLRVDTAETCLTRFDDLEAIAITDDPKSPTEIGAEVMRHFTDSLRRHEERYIVSLPCNEQHEKLHDSQSWSYCSDPQTPADVLTRFTTIENISHSNLWLRGPERLASTQIKFSPETLQTDDATSEAIYKAAEEERQIVKKRTSQQATKAHPCHRMGSKIHVELPQRSRLQETRAFGHV